MPLRDLPEIPEIPPVDLSWETPTFTRPPTGAPRRLLDPSRPPMLHGRDHDLVAAAGVVSRAAERVHIRAMLALLDFRLGAFRWGDEPGEVIVEFHYTSISRAGSGSIGVIGVSFWSTKVSLTRVEVVAWLHNEIRGAIEHELAESLWDGRPETDPHREDG